MPFRGNLRVVNWRFGRKTDEKRKEIWDFADFIVFLYANINSNKK